LDRDLLAAALGQEKAQVIVRGGNLVNVITEEIYPADVAIYESTIVGVGDVSIYEGSNTEFIEAAGSHLVPGLIDGHVHLECSKLSVSMFANAVIPFGTTSVITGLDEITGVAGLPGTRAFLDEANAGPLRLFWGSPAKLPYTMPESTIGYPFGPDEHELAFAWPEHIGIWETVQEFVFERDEKVLAALDLAAVHRLPIFGCAPMCRGAKIAALLCAGVRMDHESYTAAEALEKLRNGMWMMIRESSVAHFLEENIKVVTEYGAASRRIAFCSDDVAAMAVLEHGHMDHLVRMAIDSGVEPITAIQMATVNCAEMYRIDDQVGSISPGRHADLLLVEDLEHFRPHSVIAKGRLVAKDSQMLIPAIPPARSEMLRETFKRSVIQASDLSLTVETKGERVRVLTMAMSGSVPFVRTPHEVVLPVRDGRVQLDPDQDVAFVTVVERFGKSTHCPIAFMSGFGLRDGALASSVSPDDNNVVCIGTSRNDMALAVNSVLEAGGGQAVVSHGQLDAFLPLPIAGIVADVDVHEMAEEEDKVEKAARSLGCAHKAPMKYMSFLSVTAIPELAITDVGLIDCVNLKILDPVLGIE
jgi:adenine deaminase